LRELATHPEREQIIRDEPNLTKRKANEIMRKYEGAEEEKQEQKQEDEWLRDNRRWFRDLCTLASEASHAADVAFQCTSEKLHELLQVVDSLMLTNLGRDGRMVANLAEHLEALLKEEDQAEQTEQADAEASVPIERAYRKATAQAAA
jgi:hypothetical protein